MSDSRLIKSVRFFEQIYILKWVIFFASFCWLWDSLLENLKLKEKLQIWDFESFIFWPKFRLFGAVLRHFSECNFQIFHLHRTMVADIFTHLSHHKKASTDLNTTVLLLSWFWFTCKLECCFILGRKKNGQNWIQITSWLPWQ